MEQCLFCLKIIIDHISKEMKTLVIHKFLKSTISCCRKLLLYILDYFTLKMIYFSDRLQKIAYHPLFLSLKVTLI